MSAIDTVVAVYPDHAAADAAIKALTAEGFSIKDLSVVGQGFHTEEKAVGFYNIGDRVTVWGSRGAFWGGLWGFFLGGLMLAVPVVGHVVVLGYLGAAVIAGVENAVLVGGLSAIGAALFSLGVPKDSVVRYEAAVKADDFLVMAHGEPSAMARAKAILAATGPRQLDLHVGQSATLPQGLPVA